MTRDTSISLAGATDPTETLVRQVLHVDETHLWTGLPRWGLHVAARDLRLILVWLLTNAFFVVLPSSGSSTAAWVILSVTTSLAVLVGHLRHYYQRQKWSHLLLYAVTSQRVIFRRKTWLPEVSSLSLWKLGWLELRQEWGARGSILFPARSVEWTGLDGLNEQREALYGIENPFEIYGLLLDQQARARKHKVRQLEAAELQHPAVSPWLYGDEQLLWVGRPGPLVRSERWQHFARWIFGSSAVVIGLIWMAAWFQPLSEFQIAGLALAALIGGAWLLLEELHRVRHTYYALTDLRVLIVDTSGRGSVRSLLRCALRRIEVTKAAAGYWAVHFRLEENAKAPPDFDPIVDGPEFEKIFRATA